MTRTSKEAARAPRPLVDPEQYERHNGKIAIITGHFVLHHLNMVYQEFEGDRDKKSGQTGKKRLGRKKCPGEIVITEAVGTHFIPNFNLNLLQELLDACGQIRSVLQSKKPRPRRKKVRQARQGKTSFAQPFKIAREAAASFF